MIMKEQQQKKALVAGTLVLDIIPIFDKESSANERVTSGGTVYLNGIQTALGGAVGNTGAALHQLGAEVCLFSRIGGDAFSELTESRLKQTGCRYVVPKVEEMNTSSSLIIAPPGGDRMILHNRGASQRYAAEDIPEELLTENDLLHFGYPTGMSCMYADQGETLSAIFARAKRLGLGTSMDTSFPGVDTPSAMTDWRVILKKTLPFVDVFLPSYEELVMLLHRDRYLSMREQFPEMRMRDILDDALVAEMADELLGMGAGMIVIKCGIAGAYFKSAGRARLTQMGKLMPDDLSSWADREVWIPSLYVEHVYSTNGAGDTFVAGFLQGLLLGRTLAQTAGLAAGSAASRLESTSGSAGIPRSPEIEKRLQKGWATETFPLNGWQDTQEGILKQRI